MNIEFILFTSLVCFGVFITTWDKMIFQHIPKLYDKFCKSTKRNWINKFLCFMRKPLFGCMYCMASIWTFLTWICFLFPFKFYYLPLYMLSVCGLNGIIIAVVKKTFPKNL